ncbi:MAG TPA: response regulator transcription factor, partial [Solirubrobacterales bacterium]|nr:response regulator transcription factor [Solirubrobacterales bacterium]
GLRVLVVDDHDVVQWGFRLLLERQSWVERCLAASTGVEAVQVCRKVKPEVALVDMLLGSESGAEVCEEIHQVSPDTRVLLISGAGIISPNVARTAGAAGFISKDWSAVDVVRAVRRVWQGHEVFAEAPLDSPLSEREQEVLSLIATGSTNKEIAGHLHLSPHTVKEHTSAIYRKLGVRNRAEATRQAQRLKILV